MSKIREVCQRHSEVLLVNEIRTTAVSASQGLPDCLPDGCCGRPSPALTIRTAARKKEEKDARHAVVQQGWQEPARVQGRWKRQEAAVCCPGA